MFFLDETHWRPSPKICRGCSANRLIDSLGYRCESEWRRKVRNGFLIALDATTQWANQHSWYKISEVNQPVQKTNTHTPPIHTDTNTLVP